MALATVAVVAGTTAAALYGDAKYHIKKDIGTFIGLMKLETMWRQAVKENRQSIYYLFEESALRCGNEESIWSREGCYTWNQVYNRVNQYGHWFLSCGVKPGDHVAFYLMNSPDFVFAWIGLLSIGAAPVFINYNLSGKSLLHCLKLSGAKLMLVDEAVSLKAKIEEEAEMLDKDLGLRVVVMDEQAKAETTAADSKRPDNEYRSTVKGDSPFCLIYTSGTTGMPKACPFTMELGYGRGVAQKTGLTASRPGDRWYNCMPMYHGTGAMATLEQVLSGITLCIGKKFSTSKFWSEARDSRATNMTYVGETARYLLAAPPSPLDKDHNVRSMQGNGLRPDVWIKFRDRFGVTEVVEFFNSTEGVFSLTNQCRGDYLVAAVGHHGALSRWKLNNIYVPVRVDPVTSGIVRHPKTGFAYRERYDKGGEIVVALRSEKAFWGYYNNPEATEKKFERNLFKKGDLWYRTGDALRRTDDGRWFFMDRLGDTYRWKGENISTAEVSEVVGSFSGIVEANVYGVLLPNHDGRAGCVAIYIDPSVRSNFDFAGLLKHCRKCLPRYAVPLFLRIVQEMTPTHNNKQNKVLLRAEGVDPTKIKAGDTIHWIPLGANAYEPFTPASWEKLNARKAML